MRRYEIGITSRFNLNLGTQKIFVPRRAFGGVWRRLGGLRLVRFGYEVSRNLKTGYDESRSPARGTNFRGGPVETSTLWFAVDWAIRNVPNSVPNGQIQSQKSPIRGFYVPGGPITSREFRSPKVSGTSSSLPLRPGDAAERRTTSRGRLARPEIFRPRKFSGRPRTHLYVPGT